MTQSIKPRIGPQEVVTKSLSQPQRLSHHCSVSSFTHRRGDAQHRAILLGHDKVARPHVNGPIRIVRPPGEFAYQGGPTILQKWIEVMHEGKSFIPLIRFQPPRGMAITAALFLAEDAFILNLLQLVLG